jgi:hypothetical protein
LRRPLAGAAKSIALSRQSRLPVNRNWLTRSGGCPRSREKKHDIQRKGKLGTTTQRRGGFSKQISSKY